MRSLALRLTLLGLFLAAAGAAGWFTWTAKAQAHRAVGAEDAFDQSAVSVERDLMALRAAQEGYVAAGQGEDFWASQVDATATRLREALTGLRRDATSQQGQSAIDNAASALQDFEQLDRRARGHARTGQKLLASDLIFTDGLELAAAAAGSVEEARLAERLHRAAERGALERRSLAAGGAALAVGLIALGLLVPRPPETVAVPEVKATIAARQERSPARAEGSLAGEEGWSPAKVVPKARPAAAAPASARSAAPAAARSATPTRTPTPARTTGVTAASTSGGTKTAEGPRTSSAPVKAPAAEPLASPEVPAAAPAASLDLPRVASLCSDLARVVDTQALPALLERAATVLDAPGIILWIADPDGRELSPIVTHGYPRQLVSRLGTILRDSENATASAFRTSLVQTVKADGASNGAIAAPLVTPGGCVGVMAAEVRSQGEADAARLAIATIVAAQLATLVGPPSARTQARVEAAGA